MTLSEEQIYQFQNTVWQYYATHKRVMPWRASTEPYHVWVSELMLQQTQVERVAPKFLAFIEQFPTPQALAAAPLAGVLAAWSGLGYNRRAKFLHAAAKQVVAVHGGVLPKSQAALVALPGIGKNTAGAIMAYAFNQPVVYVETNIRSVYIHHFCQSLEQVDDALITSLAGQTLDAQNPREWYWALMDYGAYIKKSFGNNIGRSKHYKKQSRFEGSLRQVRGKVIKLLAEHPQGQSELGTVIADDRLPAVLADLRREGLIVIAHNRVQLAE